MRQRGWSYPDLAATPWRVIAALGAIDDDLRRRANV